jgi:alpha-tubulin suppressor-like RCC1 family protein
MGLNSLGQLGIGNFDSFVTIPQDAALSGVATAIAAGERHTCALVGGAAKCWGAAAQGQLGNNAAATSATPQDVVGLSSGVRAISAGSDHTCALLDNGAVKCWGENTDGQLGIGVIGERFFTPQDVQGL